MQKSEEDITFNHDNDVLRQKIKFLEEEIIRKDAAIEKLREENDILFKSMIKSHRNTE